MYNNIGGKLKLLARISFILGAFLSIVLGFALIAARNDTIQALLPGVLTIVFGAFFSWLASLGLYAFGQLVENSDTLVTIAKKDKENPYQEEQITCCPNCKNKILIPKDVDTAYCPWCDSKIKG